MKISGLEACALLAALAFLLAAGGYFAVQKGGGLYSVEAQTQWTEAVGAQEEEPARAGVERVNINTATAEELQSLPGIGPVLAQAIAEDRRENGLFRVPEDLLRVSGIGEKTVEGLLDYITVR